jgi:hypothetical protein
MLTVVVVLVVQISGVVIITYLALYSTLLDYQLEYFQMLVQ